MPGAESTPAASNLPSLPPGLMGMMSAFSNMAATQASARGQSSMSHDRSAPDSLQSKMGGGDSGMFSMLQGICKNVTQMRSEPTANTAEQHTSSTPEQHREERFVNLF